MTTEELRKLGLSGKEAELYLYCIEHGPSRVKDIAARTTLNRGTTYDISRTLIKKGLLSTTQKQNITHFIAHSPAKYMRELNEELASAHFLLPTIEDLLKSNHYRPTLHFFEGEEGIRQVYEETLNCKSKQMLVFMSVQEILEVVGVDFLKYYTKKRARRHIHLRCIKDPSGEVKEPVSGYSTITDPAVLRESRLGPKFIDVAGSFFIFDDTVALMSTKRENFGVLLHSHDFAIMFRHLFETVWNLSTTPDDL